VKANKIMKVPGQSGSLAQNFEQGSPEIFLDFTLLGMSYLSLKLYMVTIDLAASSVLHHLSLRPEDSCPTFTLRNS
jgi:hypothetical protein